MKVPYSYDGSFTLEEAIEATHGKLTGDLKLLKDFLQEALVIDPEKRTTARELLKEEWVTVTDT